MKRILSFLLVLLVLLIYGCKSKEHTYPDFSAIGRINVVQDVNESTKATLRLFTTKKYNQIKVNKIDSPEPFQWSISEPKKVVVKKGNQKHHSYYYTITITFEGPAHFSKVELSLDDVVKTYNIGRFECKEMLGYETDDDVKVYFDIPFECYQQSFVTNALIYVRVQNESEIPIELVSLKSLETNSEYEIDVMKSNLQRHELDKGEDTEATYFNLGVFTDDLMMLETLFELQYIKGGKLCKKVLKCSLGLMPEVIDSEILPIHVELDYLNNGKVCTLEEELSNSH
jgi:hypothetical protein